MCIIVQLNLFYKYITLKVLQKFEVRICVLSILQSSITFENVQIALLVINFIKYLHNYFLRVLTSL